MKTHYKKFLYIAAICIVYITINLIFNFVIVEQILKPDNDHILVIQGESFIYEYFAEVIRTNIINGKNPFTPTLHILYPFGWDFVLNDIAPINGFYFLLLRRFFSLHQSLMLIVLISVFLTNISMYYLLRFLKLSKKTAFLIGLVFGFTPFMSIRVGAHPSYSALYLFPTLTLFFLLMKQASRLITKMVYAAFLGIILAVILLTNLYYTLMAMILTLLFVVYFMIFRRTQLVTFFKTHVFFLCISILTSIVCLVPWLTKMYQFLHLSQYTRPTSWADTIFYSADLTSIIVPSRLNPFYHPLLTIAAQRAPHLINIFESFIYPGIIILSAYVFLFYFRKKLPLYLKRKVAPFVYIGVVFWILTLGPFLHIFGKKMPIPLPYVLISETPFFQMARTPGRFIVPFVFLASIATAYFVEYLFKKKYPHRARLLFMLLLIVFFIDQSYTITLPPTIKIAIPTKIYQYLKTNNQNIPILEIPFAIRDGHKNLGSFYTPWLPLTQLIHQQPSFGLYGDRIDNDVFAYYKNSSLFGPLSALIDRDATDYDMIASRVDLEKMKVSLEFFGVAHAIIKHNEPYSHTIHNLMQQLGFKRMQTDGDYALWQRTLDRNNAPDFDFGTESDELFLATGWSSKESQGRWTIGKKASILMPVEQSISSTHFNTICFRAQSLGENQSMIIYINSHPIKKLSLTTKSQSYTLSLTPYVKNGFNTLVFKFAHTYQPSRILTHSSDTRNLSAFFEEIRFDSLLSCQ